VRECILPLELSQQLGVLYFLRLRFMLALPSAVDDGQDVSHVRAIEIGARNSYPYKLKVSYRPTWKGVDFHASLHDLDGVLYHGRGATAYAALVDLMEHPAIRVHETFTVCFRSSMSRSSAIAWPAQRAHAVDPQPTPNPEQSANA
jgi:hypothetical protein